MGSPLLDHLLHVRGRCLVCCGTSVDQLIELEVDEVVSLRCDSCAAIADRIDAAFPGANPAIVDLATALAIKNDDASRPPAELYARGKADLGSPPLPLAIAEGMILARARCFGCAMVVVEHNCARDPSKMLLFGCNDCNAALSNLNRQIGGVGADLPAAGIAMYDLVGAGKTVTDPVRVRRAYNETLKKLARDKARETAN